MIGICVLTVAIALGALGITNSITSLQNAVLMNNMKKDLDEVKKEIEKNSKKE